MFCLNLFYWLTFLSTFQTTLQTLELFLFLLSLTFYGLYDNFTIVCLCLFICAPHQSSHCIVFFFFFLSDLLVRRCHFFDCVPALSESSFSVTQSFSVKGSRAAARVAKLRSLTVDDVPMIVSSSLRSVLFQKMLVPESSVLSIVVVAVIVPK